MLSLFFVYLVFHCVLLHVCLLFVVEYTLNKDNLITYFTFLHVRVTCT